MARRSSYTPFLIANIRHGLELGMAPWLAPKDAFSKMKNAFIRRGVIEKRRGYKEWERIVHLVEDEALDTTVASTLTYSGTLTYYPLQAGDLTITDDGGPHETFTDNGDETLTGDAGGSGTIDYTTGDWEITYDSDPGNGLSITADYNYHPGNPVMGIFTYYSATGTSQLIAFDTKRMNKYDSINEKMVDISESNTFSGDNSQFFWVENWLGSSYITNNNDQIQEYDGSTLSAYTIDIDGGGNDVNTALMIFTYKSHLVILRPTESGTLHPQRARWCAAGDPTDWTNDGYVDAPTLDWIMGADFLGDDLIVFFERSVWRLRYTGDSDLPFRWEQVASTEGLYATFSISAFSDELIGLGPVSMIATDNMDVYSIDRKVPDFALDIDQENYNYCYSIVIEEYQQTLMSYPALNSTYSDQMLCFNYEDNSWSIFDIGFSCYGYWNYATEPTWDDIDDTWDEIEWTWDDRETQAGYPATLAGDQDGWIYTLYDGGVDNESPIELEIESARWSPFIDKGIKCRLGWVDFLVDRDVDISFYVDFYMNQESSSYQTETINCAGNSDEDKVWVRAYCGAEATFHKIRIYHTASNQTLRIHAIMPFFKPGASL